MSTIYGPAHHPGGAKGRIVVGLSVEKRTRTVVSVYLDLVDGRRMRLDLAGDHILQLHAGIREGIECKRCEEPKEDLAEDYCEFCQDWRSQQQTLRERIAKQVLMGDGQGDVSEFITLNGEPTMTRRSLTEPHGVVSAGRGALTIRPDDE